jgi:pimeloyl-ACP methyl ester carboxylesterase
MTLDQAWSLFFTTAPAQEFKQRDRDILAQGENFEIAFNDGGLAATAWGSGPTVLLVHGWGGHRAQLGAFAAPLAAARYRAMAFDFPAHGDNPGKQTNLFEMRDALLQVAQQQGPIEAVLAHSLGGLVNLMALDAGLETTKVVQFGTLRSGQDAVERYFHIIQAPEAIRAPFWKRMESKFGEDIRDKTNGPAIAAQLSIPALLFHDRNDEVTPFSDSQSIAEAWPGSRLAPMEGLSHRRILRDPETIEAAVDFIRA